MTLAAYLCAVAKAYRRPPLVDQVNEDCVRIWGLVQWIDGTRRFDLDWPKKADAKTP